MPFNDALYFSAYDGQFGRELWKYDGAVAARVTDIDPGPGANPFVGPEELTAYNGALYFRAHALASGMELWKFDGTAASLVADIQPGTRDSRVDAIDALLAVRNLLTPPLRLMTAPAAPMTAASASGAGLFSDVGLRGIPRDRTDDAGGATALLDGR